MLPHNIPLPLFLCLKSHGKHLWDFTLTSHILRHTHTYTCIHTHTHTHPPPLLLVVHWDRVLLKVWHWHDVGLFFLPCSPVKQLCMVFCTYSCFCKQNCFIFFKCCLLKTSSPPSPSTTAGAVMLQDEVSVWKTCQWSAEFGDTKVDCVWC